VYGEKDKKKGKERRKTEFVRVQHYTIDLNNIVHGLFNFTANCDNVYAPRLM